MDRVATRKEEISVIETALKTDTIPEKIKDLEDRHALICVRCAKFVQGKDTIARWQWEDFLVTLKLGWKRYFYGCHNKDSIFVRIQIHQLKSTGGCICCLYWRAIGTGFLIASIISFLISSGKYLS